MTDALVITVAPNLLAGFFLLSTVSCGLSARCAHYSLFTTCYSLSSQFTMRRREASACRASE